MYRIPVRGSGDIALYFFNFGRYRANITVSGQCSGSKKIAMIAPCDPPLLDRLP